MTPSDATGEVISYCICDSCDKTYPASYQACTYCTGRLRLIVRGRRISEARPSLPIEHVWSLARLTEELYLHLSIVEECLGDKRVRKYQVQANALMFKIPIWRPPPPFIINLGDLPSRLISELERCNKRALQYVVKEAVGGLFEAQDLKYYRLSVAKHLVVRLEA